MTVTVDDVTGKSPEFASLDPDEIQKYIDEYAPLYISTEAFGRRADYALLLVTLHLLTLHQRAASSGSAGSGGGGVRGPIKWVQMGVNQKGYASPTSAVKSASMSDTWWQSTSWGLEFLTLRSLVFGCRALV